MLSVAGEGVIKFDCEHRLESLPKRALERFEVLATWRRRLWDLGMVGQDPRRYDGAGFGNLSMRLPPYPGPPGRRPFLITCTQTSGPRELTPACTCVVEACEGHRGWVRSYGPCKPSSESMTHGALYDADPRVRYVFHAHAPSLWRHAKELEIPITDPTVPYGTPEMAREVRRLYAEADQMGQNIIAMGGHEDGVVAFGPRAELAGGIIVQYLEIFNRAATLAHGGS